MPAPVLRVKRGALSNLPGLRAGEPAFTTDTFDFFVGIDSTTNNNKFLGSHRYWTKETSSTGSGVRFVERTDSGSNYIELKAPNSAIGSNVSFTLPATQGGSGTVLTNDGSGNLSWGSGTTNPIFTGISTFSDTTDSTSKDNGSVVIEGGVGIEKSVNIGGNIYVAGLSTFNQLVVNSNGLKAFGFSQFDDISVLGIGTVDGSFDVDGLLTASGDFNVLGITTISNTTESTTYQNGAVVINGGLGVGKNVNIHGELKVDGNVTIGGSFVTIKGQDVFIENKDFILGFTTATQPNDDTANHAGVAIASTVGTPLVSFSASGINTLPDTYKQLMWFKSGTLGFSTDTFAFNYGLAIGTTSMANGDRLAVGTGIRMTDTTITATTFNGSLSGNASSANQVKTITASNTNATYYVTFVDANNGSATNETVYTDDGIYYNPGTNTFTTQHGYFTGNVTVDGSITGTASTATRSTTVDTTGIATNQDYYLTFTDSSGTGKTIGVDAELLYNPNTNILAAPNIKSGSIKASDGTSAITITNSTGAVGLSSDLTVAGNLYINGSTTQVNTTTLNVKDSLVDLGLIDTGGGVLGAPTSDLNKDIGLLLNYYTDAAKKAAVYWDDSTSRIAIASEVSESSSVLTASAYAALEIGSLWVNDCAGQSQVISCADGVRKLENITIDAGTF
jgi:hypothetical protein